MSFLVLSADKVLSERVRRSVLPFGLGEAFIVRRQSDAEQVLTHRSDGLRLVIIDEEHPHSRQLLQLIASNPRLNFAPLLYVRKVATIGTMTEGIDEEGSEWDRIDVSVRKPINLNALRRAIRRAEILRRAEQDQILYIANYCTRATRPGIFYVHTRAELAETLLAHRHHIGLVVIDPAGISSDLAREVQQLRKTSWGSQVDYICLSKKANAIGAWRLVCNHYLAENNGIDEVLKFRSYEKAQLFLRKNIGWLQWGLLPKKYKEKLICGRKSVVSLAIALSDYFSEKKKYKKCQKILSKALEQHPCAPGLYIYLLKILQIQNAKESEIMKVREAASQYCPEHPQLRNAA